MSGTALSPCSPRRIGSSAWFLSCVVWVSFLLSGARWGFGPLLSKRFLLLSTLLTLAPLQIVRRWKLPFLKVFSSQLNLSTDYISHSLEIGDDVGSVSNLVPWKKRWQTSGSMASILWDRSIEERFAKFRKHCTHGRKGRSQLPSLRLMITLVKHIFREHNREADHWANFGVEGHWKILVDRSDNTETWKAVNGFRDGSSKDNGKKWMRRRDQRCRQGQVGHDQQNCGTFECRYSRGSRSDGCLHCHGNPLSGVQQMPESSEFFQCIDTLLKNQWCGIFSNFIFRGWKSKRVNKRSGKRRVRRSMLRPFGIRTNVICDLCLQ